MLGGGGGGTVTCTLLLLNRINKTEIAIFLSLACFLLAEDLHSDLILYPLIKRLENKTCEVFDIFYGLLAKLT